MNLDPLFGALLLALPDSELIDRARARGVDVNAHRCDCEPCMRTSQLCPATRSSLVEAIMSNRSPAP